jgi:hypothetical protein
MVTLSVQRFHGSQCYASAPRQAPSVDEWVVDLTLLEVDLQHAVMRGCMQVGGEQPAARPLAGWGRHKDGQSGGGAAAV